MLGALPIFPLLDGGSYYVGKGAFAHGDTTCAPGYPDEIRADDMLVLFVIGLPDTPSGWTAGATQNAGGPYGLPACQVYTKIASGSETGTVTVEGVSGLGAQILLYRGIASAESTIGDEGGQGATLWFLDNSLGVPQISLRTVTSGMTPVRDRDIFIHLIAVTSASYAFFPREDGFPTFLFTSPNNEHPFGYNVTRDVFRTFNVDPTDSGTMLVVERQLTNHGLSDRPDETLATYQGAGSGDRPRAAGIVLRLRPSN